MQFDFKITSALTLLFLLAVRSPTSASPSQCVEAEKKGIDFLAASQKSSGGFTTHEWRVLTPDNKRAIDTVFTAAQVLYSLSFCADVPAARGVRERAAAYLVRQQDGPGLWRYQGKEDRVPPDVDDTSMAWAALQRDGQSTSREAFNAVRASRNPDGLFNTWVGDPSTWSHIDSRDIDAVVNLNALLMFGLVQENFEAVCDNMLKRVEDDSFCRGSIYYPSPLAFTLALSRAYADGRVDCLKKAVPKIREATLALQEKDGGWGTDYETALGVLTLLNLGERGAPSERGIALLISRQMADGGWALSTIYTGADNWTYGRYIYGSRDATTAFCVEALAKYLRK